MNIFAGTLVEGLASHRTHLTVFSKMRKSCFPPGGKRLGETCLGSLNVSPFDPVKTFQTRLPGLLRSQPRLEAAGRDNRCRVPGVPPDPGTAPSLETPKDARPGRMSPADPPPSVPQSSVLPRPSGPAPPRLVFELARAGRAGRRGRGGGTGERAPKLQTAQLQLQVSGPSLQAIINLRFIFIGELESRLTLAKQGSSSRPWMRLNAGEYFCRKALQARLL